MSTLKELLANEQTRPAVIEDAQSVLDQEVNDKGGLSGVAIKAAYSVVKGIKPGFVREVIDALLDDFLDALDPLRQSAQEQGVSVADYFRRDPDQVAEKLLAITDARAENASRAVIKKTYEKLRPSAKKHVAASVPRLAQMLERHLPQG